MSRTVEIRLTKLAEQAMATLSGFFSEKEHTGREIGSARIATAIISAWTRQAQTRSAEKTTMFMVARELASDREQLADYIRLTMPDLPLVKALSEPKEV